MHSHRIGRRYLVSSTFFLSMLIPGVLVALIGFLIKPIKSGALTTYEAAKGAARSIEEFPKKFYDSVARRSGAKTEEPKPPVPEMMEVTATGGFVEIPAGTKKIVLRLRKGKPSPWLVFPKRHYRSWSADHRFYPIYYQRWSDKEFTEIGDPTGRLNLTEDCRLRVLTNFDSEEVIIHLL